MANKGQQSNSYKKETKEEIVHKYIEEGISAGALSKEYSIPKGTIKTWVHRFRHQEGGLEDTDANPKGRRRNNEEINYKERYEILKKYQAFLKAQREKK